MKKPKLAPLALRKAAKDLFDDHGWEGNVIGRPAPAAAVAANPCADGKTLHEITFEKPDGTWVTTTVCL